MKFVKAKDAQEPYDERAFSTLLDSAIDDVVRQQVNIGIDIVNDGEFSRTGFGNYPRDRLSGYEMKEPGGKIIGDIDELRFGNLVPGPARDREDFREFTQMWRRIERDMYMPEEMRGNASNTVPTRVPVCTGPITYRAMDELTEDLNRLKAVLSRVDVKGAFVSAASPSIATYLISNNEYYNTTEEYLFAMADALNVEYRAITDAGFDLQIDAPDLCHMYDPDHLDEYLDWLTIRIEAINQALRGVPEEKARLHVCWGSANRPHTKDVPLKVIIDHVLKVKTQCYSLEGANPRHSHDVLVWDDVKLPEGKILMPGMVGHVSNIVEAPELVAWRIKLYAERVGRENVIAGTDCGFSQGWNNRRAHPQVQWAKLQSLVDGAALASKELW